MKKQKDLRNLYYLPLTIWMTLFFAIPTAIIVYFSFLKKGPYGGIVSYTSYSLKAYKELITPELLKIVLKTFNISVVITAVVIFLSIPTAYFLSRSKYKNLWLLLIVIPFWTNFLVRIFALVGLIGNNGIINKFFMRIFNLSAPIPLLYNRVAVVIVSVYIFMPYAILPLYTAIEKFDFSLIDAARDLGANAFQRFFRVILPLTMPGIIAGCLLVLLPAMGMFYVADLLGGAKVLLVGNVIKSEFLISRNWPFGSAISIGLTVLMALLIFVYYRANKLLNKKVELE